MINKVIIEHNHNEIEVTIESTSITGSIDGTNIIKYETLVSSSPAYARLAHTFMCDLNKIKDNEKETTNK